MGKLLSAKTSVSRLRDISSNPGLLVATSRLAMNQSTYSVSSFLSLRAGVTTNNFNTECNNYLNDFNARREVLNAKVEQELSIDPTYDGSRGQGVKLAKDYERADIAMGGKGSGDWTAEDIAKIRRGEWVEGAEGHHINNVADHQELQANPDNIKYYRNREDHVNKGHGGDVNNESHGDLIDKNAMLKRTNAKRVIRNELKGLGLAVGIGIGVGFTISLISRLAQGNYNSHTVGSLIFDSLRDGLAGGAASTCSYAIGRGVTYGLSKLGLDISSKVGSILNFSAVGIAMIAFTAIVQYAGLKKNGYSKADALRQVAKQTLVSSSILAASIIAQGIWGGCAGVAVSTTLGLAYFGCTTIKMVRDRKSADKIREYAIEQYKNEAIYALQ